MKMNGTINTIQVPVTKKNTKNKGFAVFFLSLTHVLLNQPTISGCDDSADIFPKKQQ